MKLFYGKFGVIVMTCLLAALSHAQSGTTSLKTPEKNQFKNFKLSSQFSLGGVSSDEGQDEAQLVYFSARPKADLSLTESFGVRGDGQLTFGSARSQTRFQNPNFDLLNLHELVAYYQPANFLEVQVGAINQDHYNSRMFIADRSFPGIFIGSGFKIGTLEIKPKFQHAIPTSTSFESDRTEAEALPSLQTLGFQASWQPRHWFNLEANVNQFKYSDLPSVVAFQSSRFGNSVIGTDPSESHFRYQFEGLQQSYSLKFDYTSRIKQQFYFTIIDNDKAPSDRRRSQWVATDLTLIFNDFNITPYYAMFFAESDSVPALYSAYEYGRNNRDGQFYQLEIDFKKLGFKAMGVYSNSKLIESKPLQEDLQVLEVRLEFEYDIL